MIENHFDVEMIIAVRLGSVAPQTSPVATVTQTPSYKGFYSESIMRVQANPFAHLSGLPAEVRAHGSIARVGVA